MSNSLSATLPVDLKTTGPDRTAVEGRVAASSHQQRAPKRFGRRGVFLVAVGALILAGLTFWFVNNAGDETTDDASIEGM
ncbi:MAG: hypothetical protein JO279_10820 [Verrucomicrobia bacterium]|nr:hypothetical protein [Verrucomicrobiota bacterium]